MTMGMHETGDVPFGGRLHSVRALALLLCLSACAWAIEDDTWHSSVKSSNEDSIVFIVVKTRYPNGLEDPQTGTGFIVHPDGYLITCSHVVPEAKDGTVVEVSGAVGGRDKELRPLEIGPRDKDDLMLLKLPKKELAWVPVKEKGQVGDGAEILGAGFPFGKKLLLSRGFVDSADENGRFVTTTPLFRGMSGGPIFDRRGRVAGIIVEGYEMLDRLNLFIPIQRAVPLLEQIHSPLLPTVKLVVDEPKNNPLVRDLKNEILKLKANWEALNAHPNARDLARVFAAAPELATRILNIREDLDLGHKIDRLQYAAYALFMAADAAHRRKDRRERDWSVARGIDCAESALELIHEARTRGKGATAGSYDATLVSYIDAYFDEERCKFLLAMLYSLDCVARNPNSSGKAIAYYNELTPSALIYLSVDPSLTNYLNFVLKLKKKTPP
jgi:hypothetical protein